MERGYSNAGNLNIHVATLCSTPKVCFIPHCSPVFAFGSIALYKRRANVLGVPLTNSHNTRSTNLTFHIPHAGPLHGLAGYFEAHLYSNIGLSIHPETAHRVSPDMFSWFPLFFPFKEPLYLPSGSELDVNVWRLWDGSKRKIWYEWTAEAFLPTSTPPPPSNPSGTAGAANLTPGPIRTSTGPGGIPASPMMDAPFSPGFPTASWPNNDVGARIKIGQTTLHNAGGAHSWVGL